MPPGIRSNGFQAPLSKDQVISWVLQPFMMSVRGLQHHPCGPLQVN
jgi:hypothetical protein